MNKFVFKIAIVAITYAAIGVGAGLLWGIGAGLFSIGLALLLDQIIMGVLDVCDSRVVSR